MPPHDMLGDPGPPVMLGTEDDDIRAQLVRSLKNDVRDLVFGGIDEFSVDRDSRRGEVVDGVLRYFCSPAAMSSSPSRTPSPDPALMSYATT